MPLDGWGLLILPILALAVGLIDGFSGSSLSGYRDMVRETFILSVLFALGLLPATMALGRTGLAMVVSLMPIICVPVVALVAGAR